MKTKHREKRQQRKRLDQQKIGKWSLSDYERPRLFRKRLNMN